MRLVRYALLCFKFNIASALQYRASFLMQALSMAVSNSSFIFFWWIAFTQMGGAIAGYTFSDVMFIWSVSCSAYGVGHVIFGGVGRISGAIITSEMDAWLLQPKPVLLSALCSGSSFSAWGDLLYGVILILITNNDPRSLMLYGVGTLVGALLFIAVSVMGHTLTFYFGDSSFAGSMVGEFMINFSIYPQNIYTGVLRGIMYTILPAAFISHVPLQLARQFSPQLFVGLLVAAALYCALACWFFGRGLKRYESGNLIVTRL